MSKPEYTFLEALILAHHAGPEYRVCKDGEDAARDECRCRWDGQSGYVVDNGDGGKCASFAPAVIIRPAKREVSLVEALRWAEQDESREYEDALGTKYRVRESFVQFKRVGSDWCDIDDYVEVHLPVTMGEGWEEVELEVKPK
jgi:hypothetical protein